MSAELGRRHRWGDALRVVGRGREARRLGELLAFDRDSSLIDIGGGSGAFTARFASRVGVVSIVEPDERTRAQGAARRPGFVWLDGRGESLPVPDASCDRISAIRSTHHMDDPDRFFREAFRALLPGGRIVLEELIPGGLVPRIMLRRLHAHQPHAHGPVKPGELRARLHAAQFDSLGLEVRRRWYFVWGRKPSLP